MKFSFGVLCWSLFSSGMLFATPETVLAQGIFGMEIDWHLPAEIHFPDHAYPVEGTLYLTATPSPLIPPRAFFEPHGSDDPPEELPRLGPGLALIAQYKSTAVLNGSDRERRGILQHLAFAVKKHRFYQAAGFTSVAAEDYLEIQWADGDYEILNSPFPLPDKDRAVRRITISEVVNPFRKETFCHWALSRLGAILF